MIAPGSALEVAIFLQKTTNLCHYFILVWGISIRAAICIFKSKVLIVAHHIELKPTRLGHHVHQEGSRFQDPRRSTSSGTVAASPFPDLDLQSRAVFHTPCPIFFRSGISQHTNDLHLTKQRTS